MLDHTTRVRNAAQALGAATTETRNAILASLATLIRANVETIIETNKADVAVAQDQQLSPALVDRLSLDEGRVEDMASAVDQIIALDDPVGELLEDKTLDYGLQITKIRVPFGVVCVVYEARPNVTVDAAAIAIKTGNGIVLRGSRQAAATNELLVKYVHEALREHEFGADCVWNFPPQDRDAFKELIATEGSVDLVIPRGGEGLKKFLYEHARVPILAAAGGNCHVFIDETADKEMARDIVVNAKTHRPGVCNAAETMLVHENRAHDLMPYLIAHLEQAGVEVVSDADGFATEFLDMKIAVGTVKNVQAAIAHINTFGTQHSEAIVTDDEDNAKAFAAGVDAAAIYINASTRFTDGGVYGMGAEVGISTNKLHARGPIGLRELTTTKYVVWGDGHIRS